jgi:hypothetical protein
MWAPAIGRTGSADQSGLRFMSSLIASHMSRMGKDPIGRTSTGLLRTPGEGDRSFTSRLCFRAIAWSWDWLWPSNSSESLMRQLNQGAADNDRPVLDEPRNRHRGLNSSLYLLENQFTIWPGLHSSIGWCYSIRGHFCTHAADRARLGVRRSRPRGRRYPEGGSHSAAPAELTAIDDPTGQFTSQPLEERSSLAIMWCFE